jgi:hypothetical protein
MAHARAVPGRQRRPPRLRGARRSGGPSDVLTGRVGRVGELLARDGGDDLADRLAGRLDPLAGDEVPEGANGGGQRWLLSDLVNEDGGPPLVVAAEPLDA